MDTVFECVIPYVEDPKDRDAISLVCRRWYELDATTRRHITIALCYTTTPARLRRRFRNLESLKLKGKPRAAMFNLIPEDWGGYVTPWVEEIAASFNSLKSIHFRRMIVRDSDLEVLAKTRGKNLLVLKLDKCCGFSTDGLLHVSRSCRCLLFPLCFSLLSFFLSLFLIVSSLLVSCFNSLPGWLLQLSRDLDLLQLILCKKEARWVFFVFFMFIDLREWKAS